VGAGGDVCVGGSGALATDAFVPPVDASRSADIGGVGGGGVCEKDGNALQGMQGMQGFQGMGGWGFSDESLEASPVKSAQQRTGIERERERAEEREAREARATRDIIERAGVLCVRL